MANIALTAAKIAPVYTDPGRAEIYNVEFGETITRGQALCWDTDEQMVLADGNDAALDEPWAIALEGGLSGETKSVLHRGACYGFTVAALDCGGKITLTDTPGTMEEAGAGEVCGRIIALSGGLTTDNVIFFDFSTLTGIG